MMRAVRRLVRSTATFGAMALGVAVAQAQEVPPGAESPTCIEWPIGLATVREAGETAVLGRLLPGYARRVHGPADTGRVRVDSTRVIAVERLADDAPAWARVAVARAGGRLPVVRRRPLPGCDAAQRSLNEWVASKSTPPDGVQAVFELQLVADTVDGIPRALGVVAAGGQLAFWPRPFLGERVPDWSDSLRVRLHGLAPTPARWLAWWETAERLGARGRPGRPDSVTGGDRRVARAVVAWSERHRDSAAAYPTLGVVQDARWVLKSHAARTLRSPFEGTWTANVVDSDGRHRHWTLDVRLGRDERGLPDIAPAAEPLDTLALYERARRVFSPRTVDDILGAPGWTPLRDVAALVLALGADRPACIDRRAMRADPSCLGSTGRLVHDVVPLYADADSAVHAASVDLGSLAVFQRREFEADSVLLDGLDAGAMWSVLEQLAEIRDRQTTRDLLPATRQGRCVVYRRTGAARCTYRGLSSNGEVLSYELRRPPTSR